MRKYEIAKILRDHGLSFSQIARTIYPGDDVDKAKLKVNALLHYARRRYTVSSGELYEDGYYTVVGERDPLRHRGPLDWSVSRERKEVLDYDEQVRLDLEQVLWHLAVRVMSEAEREELFPYLRAVNNIMYKKYGRRVGSRLYPRILAYAYVVYHLALWHRAPHIVLRLREHIHSLLNTRRALKYFRELVSGFIAVAPPELLA